ARHRHGAGGGHDPRPAPRRRRRSRGQGSPGARLILWLAALFWAVAASAGDLRLATWNADLSRDGPGLLLRDILSAKDPEVEAVVQGLLKIRPDIVLLTRFDHDLNGVALGALADRLVAG